MRAGLLLTRCFTPVLVFNIIHDVLLRRVAVTWLLSAQRALERVFGYAAACSVWRAAHLLPPWEGCQRSRPRPPCCQPTVPLLPPPRSKKLKWYALCPVVDSINHSSLVEVRWHGCSEGGAAAVAAGAAAGPPTRPQLPHAATH